MRVLVVEDDPGVAEHVERGLGEAGFATCRVGDGASALERLGAGAYSAVVLDRMLPGLDGLKVLQTLRARGDRTPVLILSALGELDDRVEGLKLGGDDYLAKPFAISELTARVQALTRRATETERTRLVFGDLEMDLVTREVRRGGRRADLTVREFRLLEFLMRNAGATVTRAMILETVWGYSFDPQTNIIDQHVRRLRQKIDRDGERSLIQTVRGAGYALGADGG